MNAIAPRPDDVAVDPLLDNLSHDEIVELLKDPHWRLRNIYFIRNKDGDTVRFNPWPEQERFLHKIWNRNVIPKARQRGFSTVVQLMILDACLFVDNIGAAIIAETDDLAKGIRDDKIKFAWERLPASIRAMNPLETDNVTELKWRNGSFLIVATSTRSRTLQYLHVSEYGKICAKSPAKAKEIRDGSLPSVDLHGIIVIESTAEGNDGDFFDKVMTAKAHKDAGKRLTPMDYRLHFASWWDADEYQVDEPALVHITQKQHAYFDRAEVDIGQDISLPRRAWYVNKLDSDFSGDWASMKSQFPTTLDEAFEVAADGKWLVNEISLARRQNRITIVPYDPSEPVYTWWDLHHGGTDDVAVWFHQLVGAQERFIDYLEASGETYSHIVREVKAKPYVFGTHFLPHDGARRFPGADQSKTVEDILTDLGLGPIEIVDKTNELLTAIRVMKDDFNTYWFDAEKCATGIKHLEHYAKEFNVRHGVWTSVPAKNGNQHAADAIRQRSQWGKNLLTIRAGQIPKRRNRGGMAA
jgi:hypothetical protein